VDGVCLNIQTIADGPGRVGHGEPEPVQLFLTRNGEPSDHSRVAAVAAASGGIS
jgi:hypothetical protein